MLLALNIFICAELTQNG